PGRGLSDHGVLWDLEPEAEGVVAEGAGERRRAIASGREVAAGSAGGLLHVRPADGRERRHDEVPGGGLPDPQGPPQGERRLRGQPDGRRERQAVVEDLALLDVAVERLEGPPPEVVHARIPDFQNLMGFNSYHSLDSLPSSVPVGIL